MERLITDVDMEHDLLTRQQSGLADELRACQVQKEDLEKSVSLKSQELQSVQLENETVRLLLITQGCLFLIA